MSEEDARKDAFRLWRLDTGQDIDKPFDVGLARVAFTDGWDAALEWAREHWRQLP